MRTIGVKWCAVAFAVNLQAFRESLFEFPYINPGATYLHPNERIRQLYRLLCAHFCTLDFSDMRIGRSVSVGSIWPLLTHFILVIRVVSLSAKD